MFVYVVSWERIGAYSVFLSKEKAEEFAKAYRMPILVRESPDFTKWTNGYDSVLLVKVKVQE